MGGMNPQRGKGKNVLRVNGISETIGAQVKSGPRQRVNAVIQGPCRLRRSRLMDECIPAKPETEPVPLSECIVDVLALMIERERTAA